MTDLIPLFAVNVGLAAVLANIAIWSPGHMWMKLTALATTAAFIPATYLSLSEMLSRPKPIEIQWAMQELKEASVIGSRLEEGEAIYVWLGIEGIDEPRAYTLPWDDEMARQLHGAERSAEQDGTQVRMRKPFETSLDDREPVFYAAPPPPPPLKAAPEQNPLRFRQEQSAGSGSAE